jgi:hypothetical protein
MMKGTVEDIRVCSVRNDAEQVCRRRCEKQETGKQEPIGTLAADESDNELVVATTLVAKGSKPEF